MSDLRQDVSKQTISQRPLSYRSPNSNISNAATNLICLQWYQQRGCTYQSNIYKIFENHKNMKIDQTILRNIHIPISDGKIIQCSNADSNLIRVRYPKENDMDYFYQQVLFLEQEEDQPYKMTGDISALFVAKPLEIYKMPNDILSKFIKIQI